MNKLAVVTGGAQGIGEAVARILSENDVHVVVVDVQESGRGVAESLQRLGHAADFRQVDLTNRRQVDELSHWVNGEYGEVHYLVNNAGWTPNEYFVDQSEDVWNRIIDINYKAVLYTCAAFIPLMPPDGAIVNVASDAARVGVPKEAVYAGAKAATIAFSKSLAVELSRQRIRVNVVSPGTTLTPLVREMLSEDQVARRVRAIPLGRLGEANDVAAVVKFLLLDALYVTGQLLSVNGGSSRVD